MWQNCESWSVSLPDETRRGCTSFCSYCTDNAGNLKPRDVVQQGIACQLKSWQGDLGADVTMERVGHFMKAMPAWAETLPVGHAVMSTGREAERARAVILAPLRRHAG